MTGLDRKQPFAKGEKGSSPVTYSLAQVLLMYFPCQLKQRIITKIRLSFVDFLNADHKAQTFLSNGLGVTVTTQHLGQRGHIFLAMACFDSSLENARNKIRNLAVHFGIAGLGL